ncbi:MULTISPECIES: class I SAM-dependent methyltransferase [unclassified Mesorhizobium]|uniref:class I SAM-dependent methyltransferase n=1 Tax=unclassified Mesorhizobium TaxID=325217 RepID=UPI0003CF9028|nr:MULTISPECIES: class I SAM-dependent methyltransferase [unclassified Mesorhizobium]ESY53104.1 hypothetical protein X745_17585 [Mesorhizobium sp. LNJC374B00]ESY59718.1 hypothetical protein X744_11505 [Mesorhizobium sp. LNJC372A00]ESZ58291.1 hypothetical protein X729_19635 [Mesorhizobium sp. L103C131B0]ESZ60157.1 hypothetical protein X728_16955 [Mesorhizobium sp. L103C120A0]WJI44038.1 class I SAM-dependent methyltransferase [Mesorhizobium sp. C120A]
MQDADYGKRVTGKPYLGFLEDIHKQLKPNTYFEIGVQFGDTIKLASCSTVGVDPFFSCQTNIIGKKPTCQLFQQTSDAFFAERDLSRIFGKSVDLAFLDGMHRFEFLLRDFINTEKHCAPESIVAMHDCLPPGFYMTSRDIADAKHPRSAFPGWWAGDVWKIVPTLKHYRPELSITVTDSAPTGLVLITGLDPENDALWANYEKIIAGFQPMDRSEFAHYWSSVSVVSTDSVDLGRFRPFS